MRKPAPCLHAALLVSLIGWPVMAQIESGPKTAVKAVGRVISLRGESHDISGSGVVISSDGLVITCDHIVGHAERSRQILFSDIDTNDVFRPPDARETLKLEIVRTLPEYDLALLRITGYADGRPVRKGRMFHSVPIGKSDQLALLDSVYLIGFPKVGGETVTVIEGRVAGKDVANRWIKLDAAISRGYSGGAVVNSRGELIGVPTELRADLEDVGSDQASDSKVLYGVLGWVRPAEIISDLMTTARDAEFIPLEKAARAAEIDGRVVGMDGTPLSGAVVGLLKFGSRLATADNVLTYARTNGDGEFVLRTVPGKYTLRINCPGYMASLRTVDLKAVVTVRVSLVKGQHAREGFYWKKQ